jgi:hypothetical protein
MIHELSLLAGKSEVERQRELTERSIHWLSILVLGLGGLLSILAEPVITLAGGRGHAAVIDVSFAVMLAGFAVEMIATPATNLLVAEADPRVIAGIGFLSLVGAAIYWASPLGEGVLGVAQGLAVSYLIKGVANAGYARGVFGTRVFARPASKTVMIAGGAFLARASLQHEADPWICAMAFLGLTAVLFQADLRAMLRAARPPV